MCNDEPSRWKWFCSVNAALHRVSAAKCVHGALRISPPAGSQRPPAPSGARRGSVLTRLPPAARRVMLDQPAALVPWHDQAIIEQEEEN